MSPFAQPVCARQAPCKCCGAAAGIFGVVDFHKHCAIARGQGFTPAGIPVYYYRCPDCRFIFTTAFDHFTTADFQRVIYNTEYQLVDPDFQEVRPRAKADIVCRFFPQARPKRLLDYGGGDGLLADFLRSAGFLHVDTYDPFVPRFSTKPSGRYDCIVSFEVAEHATDPVQTFTEMNDLLLDPGLIFFSTLLQPADIDQQGLNWWYAGPRNGHISLHSRLSLQKLAQSLGFKLGSFSNDLHVFARTIPEFARHLIH